MEIDTRLPKSADKIEGAMINVFMSCFERKFCNGLRPFGYTFDCDDHHRENQRPLNQDIHRDGGWQT